MGLSKPHFYKKKEAETLRSENSEGILTLFLTGDIDAQNAAEIQQEKMNIYRRILRTALWGSCVTFVVMGGIFLARENNMLEEEKYFA